MQATKRILMIRPKHFCFDDSTAASNSFQKRSKMNPQALQEKALQEFDHSVLNLKSVKVNVDIFEDREEVECPNAVFPNNWFSTHRVGEENLIIVYPMESAKRRLERRDDVIEHLNNLTLQAPGNKEAKIVDLSGEEQNGRYLEGTGSIVFDYIGKTAFACLSPRTNVELLQKVCDLLDYKFISFSSKSRQGVPIYHTNVMMWIGTSLAAICFDSIACKEEREEISKSLNNRKVLDLSHQEIESFCGNCIELRNSADESVLVMSQTARKGFRKETLDEIKSNFDHVVACEIESIEICGGGSIRCMIAGIFF